MSTTQIFGNVLNYLRKPPAIITVIFFYELDNLFGKSALDCPCTLPEYLRRRFAWALLICPALIIFLVDMPVSLLCGLAKAKNCLCQQTCGGALMAVLKPIGFSLAWIFIFEESTQFSKCLEPADNTTGCIEDAYSTESYVRVGSVVLLGLITAAFCVRALIQCLGPCCCDWCSKCLTVHPDCRILQENLSFSTFVELEEEHLLTKDDFIKECLPTDIEKLNIGKVPKIILNKYINSPERQGDQILQVNQAQVSGGHNLEGVSDKHCQRHVVETNPQTHEMAVLVKDTDKLLEKDMSTNYGGIKT